MNKIKASLASSLVILASFALVSVAAAASLDMNPAAATVTAGQDFNTSVAVMTAGEKVCTVKGTLQFTNLTCQSIAVSGVLAVQQAPTCQNPTFTVGITKCTTTNKDLFTVSVKAGSPGNGSINLSAVSLIGEGVVLGSAANNGNYTINSAAVPTTQPQPQPTSNTGSGEIQEVTLPGGENQSTVTEEQPTLENIDLSSPAAVSQTSAGSWIRSNLWWLLLLALLIAGAAYYYWKKKSQQQVPPTN